MTPSGMRGVLIDAVSIYFLDATLLAYTMPLWAVPLGRGLSREVLSSGRLAGVTIGFAGLVLFMNPALID